MRICVARKEEMQHDRSDSSSGDPFIQISFHMDIRFTHLPNHGRIRDKEAVPPLQRLLMRHAPS